MKVYNFKGNKLTIIGDVNYHLWFKFRDIQRILGCSRRSLKYIDDEKDIKRFSEICEHYPNEVSANENDTIYISECGLVDYGFIKKYQELFLEIIHFKGENKIVNDRFYESDLLFIKTCELETKSIILNAKTNQLRKLREYFKR